MKSLLLKNMNLQKKLNELETEKLDKIIGMLEEMKGGKTV